MQALASRAMRTARLRPLCAMLASATVVATAPALRAAEVGENLPCHSVRLAIDPRLDATWTSAATDLRAKLEGLGPSECGHVAIAVDRDVRGAAVRALASDGRETRRTLGNPRSLAPVVLGLLAMAPDEPSARQPSALALAVDPRELPPPDEKPATPLDHPKDLGLTVGVATGVRAGLPTQVAMADAELRVDLHVREWFVLASLRYAPIAASPRFLNNDGDTYSEIAVALGVGRTFRAGPSTFDLALVPSVAVLSMETSDDVDQDLAELRIGGSGRWAYPIGGNWRFTVTLDSDLAPGAFAGSSRADPTLPPFPAWTMGLRVGAAASLL
jgi:hypothetical protein